jgi:hypothetical protein
MATIHFVDKSNEHLMRPEHAQTNVDLDEAPIVHTHV